MSGLEIAGIVLGAFPVLTQGLKQFREWAKTAEHFKHIHLEYNRWLSELGVQELYFKNHLKTLLLPTLIDDARIRALLADPSGPGWKEETVVAAIRTRLGDGFELYLQCLEGMHDTLQEMREELPLSDDSMQKYIQISSVSSSDGLSNTMLDSLLMASHRLGCRWSVAELVFQIKRQRCTRVSKIPPQIFQSRRSASAASLGPSGP